MKARRPGRTHKKGSFSGAKVRARAVREAVRGQATLSSGLVHLRQVRRRVAVPYIPLVQKVIGRRSVQSVEGISVEAALHARHNFRFGVLNGIVFTLVDSLMSPALVLAWFINRLGAPNVLVGTLPAIIASGGFLPQIVVASRVQGRPLVMQVYRRAGIARILLIALLTVLTVALAGQPLALLIVFFILYALYALAGGISTVPWLEMVSKTIPLRRRGIFFGMRSFFGGLLGLLAAGLIGALLAEQLPGLAFPNNFAVLFGLATLAIAIGIWAWTSVREPVANSVPAPVSVGHLMKRGWHALGVDRDYRAFMLVRILMALATMSDPFYAVYARSNLGAPASTIGVYLAASTGASLLSNFIWSPLADHAGRRTLMIATVSAVALVPLTALLLSLLKGAVASDILFIAFALVFVFGGLAAGSGGVINNHVVLSIAPPADRVTYIGFLNTVLGLVTFFPVLGGVVADTLGFSVLFFLSVLLVLSAMLAATGIRG